VGSIKLTLSLGSEALEVEGRGSRRARGVGGERGELSFHDNLFKFMIGEAMGRRCEGEDRNTGS
tara:strand:+ start:132 stop:323 length:192 start_codon:yes stop_codon:yes gene_type:complete